jgi:hypothetical protein
MITQLTLAEEYLASRNKVGRYLELEKTQLAFDQLQKNRSKLGYSPAKQQLFSEIAFRLIDSPEGDRVYASIPDAREVLDDICKALETELLSNQITAQRKQIEKVQPNDLFGKMQDVTAEETTYLATFKALRGAKDQSAIHEIIQNAISAKKERDRANRRGNSALESIRKANTAMADAVNLLPAQVTKDGIAEQIKAIEQSIKKVHKWLEQ